MIIRTRRPRHRHRHRAQGPALYPRVHQEPRQPPAAAGRVRRGRFSHGVSRPFARRPAHRPRASSPTSPDCATRSLPGNRPDEGGHEDGLAAIICVGRGSFLSAAALAGVSPRIGCSAGTRRFGGRRFWQPTLCSPGFRCQWSPFVLFYPVAFFLLCGISTVSICPGSLLFIASRTSFALVLTAFHSGCVSTTTPIGNLSIFCWCCIPVSAVTNTLYPPLAAFLNRSPFWSLSHPSCAAVLTSCSSIHFCRPLGVQWSSNTFIGFALP